MAKQTVAPGSPSRHIRGKSPSRDNGLSVRESRAVERVRAGLRELLPSGELKSLVVYGSRLRGDARRHSDLDLFLVYDHVTPEQEKALKEFSDNLWDEIPPVHLFLYPAVELARDNGTSPLIYNVSHHGRLLEGEPMPELEIDRGRVAQSLIDKAKDNLDSARLLFANHKYRNAISTAYYAALYAADAALATKGLVAQSHTGTETLINTHFIRPGLISDKFKGLLRRARKDRVKADYDRDAQFNRDQAEYWLARATEFVNVVEPSLESWLEGGSDQI